MAGTGWQSSDLLSRWNRLTGRPPLSDAISDGVKYGFLADGQDSVLTEIATIAPKSLYGPPTAMATADNGLTWTFGLDGNGYPCVPIAAHIYPSLNAVPDYPWIPGTDYLDEGEQIRMMNNVPYNGTLYWYGITPPQQISATVQPVLQPPASRILIVIKAVQNYARESIKNPALVDEMESMWQLEFPKQMTMIRKHFRGRHYSGFSGRVWGFPMRIGA